MAGERSAGGRGVRAQHGGRHREQAPVARHQTTGLRRRVHLPGHQLTPRAAQGTLTRTRHVP